MNILPKKRWHVRTKDNIARVRRDEAKANEEERKRLEKLQYAESEARIKFLRDRSRPNNADKQQSDASTSVISQSQHVNLFSDYQSHIKTTNKDLENEKKEEKEKYEKQIGYLTYLGQNTNEALKLRSWYEMPPRRPSIGGGDVNEKDVKNKYTNDPLTLIKTLLPPEKNIQQKPAFSPSPIKSFSMSKEDETVKLKKRNKKEKTQKRNKHKKHKKKMSKEKKQNEERKLAELQRKKDILDKLRKERLKREATERARQDALITPKDAQSTETILKEPKAVPTPRIVQKYNSQFNPELAKQNMI